MGCLRFCLVDPPVKILIKKGIYMRKKTFYDIMSSFLSIFKSGVNHIVRRKVLECREKDSDYILDVGGRRSGYTCGIDSEVHIMDKYENMDDCEFDEFKKIMNRKRGNVREILRGDIEDNNLLLYIRMYPIFKNIARKYYDICTFIEVIEHLDNPENAIRNIRVMLKTGGYLILTTPNGAFVENNNPEHKSPYKIHELRDIFMRNGFEIIELSYICRDFKYRRNSFFSWSLRRPIRTIFAMAMGFIANELYASGERYDSHNILIIARKMGGW